MENTTDLGDPWMTGGAEYPETPIGQVAGYPAEGSWNHWIMEQGAIWIDINNNVFLISKISERYAWNILRFIWRRGRIHRDPESYPLVVALVDRIRGGWGNYRLRVEVQRGFGGELPALPDKVQP